MAFIKKVSAASNRFVKLEGEDLSEYKEADKCSCKDKVKEQETCECDKSKCQCSPDEPCDDK